MKESQIIEMFWEKMKQDRISNHEGIDLGTLHMLLDNYDPEDKLVFSNGMHLDGFYDSYRGYYEDIAFGYGSVQEGDSIQTVGQFTQLIADAMSDGEMQGYKGGDYDITDATLVWFANYGITTGAVKPVHVLGMKDTVFIHVVEDED